MVHWRFVSCLSVFLVSSPEATGVALVCSAVISLIVLSAALYVILSKKYTPKDKHWAYATIGTVLGFWLRQA